MAEGKEDRYTRGFKKIKEIDREAGERVIESLKDIAPDSARPISVSLPVFILTN
jgi:4-carboxymuconolactone decarboxylase